MKDSAVEELFKETLSEDYNDALAWDSLRTLQSLGTREIFDKAVSWCASPDALTRARGADILAQFGITQQQPEPKYPQESYRALADMLAKETDILPLGAAITALGHLRNPDSAALIAPFHAHPHTAIRFSTAFALGTFADDPHAVSALLKLVHDTDNDVRNWAIFSLGVQGDTDSPEIREALFSRLNDPMEDARLEALVGLAKRKDKRALTPLLNTLKGSDVAVGAIEAACFMLDMEEDRKEWKAADYAKALRERFNA